MSKVTMNAQRSRDLVAPAGVTLLVAAVAFVIAMLAGGASFGLTSSVLAPAQTSTHAVMPTPTPGPSLVQVRA